MSSGHSVAQTTQATSEARDHYLGPRASPAKHLAPLQTRVSQASGARSCLVSRLGRCHQEWRQDARPGPQNPEQDERQPLPSC